MQIPINSIAWCLGGVTLWTLALKSYLSDSTSRNPLAGSHFLLGLTLGSGLFLYGFPPIVTRQPHSLLITYYLTTFFVQLGCLVIASLFWFISLRERISAVRFLLPFIIVSATIMALEISHSTVQVDQSAIPVKYMDTTTTTILKSVMYIGTCFPVGFFLVWQSRHGTLFKAKLKSIVVGLTYIIVSAAAAWNSLIDHGSDTVHGSVVNIFIFSACLLVLIIPASRRRLRF